MAGLVALAVVAATLYEDARNKICATIAAVEPVEASRRRAARYEPFARLSAAFPDMDEWVIEHNSPVESDHGYIAQTASDGLAQANPAHPTITPIQALDNAVEQRLPEFPSIIFQLGEDVRLPVNVASVERLAERFATALHDRIALHIPEMLLHAGGISGNGEDSIQKLLPKLERFAQDSLPFPRASLARRVLSWTIDVALLSLFTAPLRGSMKSILFVLGWTSRDLLLGYWGLQSPGRFLVGQILLSTRAAKEITKSARRSLTVPATYASIVSGGSTIATPTNSANIVPFILPAHLQYRDIFATILASSLRHFMGVFSPFSLLAYGFVSIYTIPALVSGDGRTWWDRFSGVQVIDREIYMQWSRTGRIPYPELEQKRLLDHSQSVPDTTDKRRSWVVRLDVKSEGEQSQEFESKRDVESIPPKSKTIENPSSSSSNELSHQSITSNLNNQISQSSENTHSLPLSLNHLNTGTVNGGTPSLSFFGHTSTISPEQVLDGYNETRNTLVKSDSAYSFKSQRSRRGSMLSGPIGGYSLYPSVPVDEPGHEPLVHDEDSDRDQFEVVSKVSRGHTLPNIYIPVPMQNHESMGNGMLGSAVFVEGPYHDQYEEDI